MSGLRYEAGRDLPLGAQEKLADKVVEQLRTTGLVAADEPVKPVRFTILSAPYAISFECPHCHMKTEISWKEANAPAYWGDPWPDAECPHCKKEVELGEWEYD